MVGKLWNDVGMCFAFQLPFYSLMQLDIYHPQHNIQMENNLSMNILAALTCVVKLEAGKLPNVVF